MIFWLLTRLTPVLMVPWLVAIGLALLLGRIAPHTELAFASERDGDWDIYTIDVVTNIVYNLSRSSAHDRRPSWSPDGGKIAFQSTRAGTDGIFVIDADGGGLHQIALIELVNGTQELGVIWTRDSQQVIVSFLNGMDWSYFIANADGSDLRKFDGDVDAIWLPETREELIMAYREGDWGYDARHRATGSVRQVVQSGVKLGELPAWSPDETWIAFVSTRDGNDEIYLVDADGLNLNRLTFHPAADTSPAWRPQP